MWVCVFFSCVEEFVCACVFLRVSDFLSVCRFVCAGVVVWLCGCAFVFLCVVLCVSICVCVCVFVCLCACVFV